MKTKVLELRRKLTDVRGQMDVLNNVVVSGETVRGFSGEERQQWDGLVSQADAIEAAMQREERMGTLPTATQPQPGEQRGGVSAPAHNRIALGDSEERAFSHFVRTGDAGGLQQSNWDLRASNDTDMNVGTAADGGNAVPTGHYQGIIARRDESLLLKKLGVMTIPGKGTTVNVPLDSEDDGEFVSTSENGASDRDAPALGKKAMTLLMYTKAIELSHELMNDEDSRLMEFLNNFVGRGVAKTHNGLLLTEVGTNGTALKTFASASAIASGEPEDIVGNDALGNYLDDESGIGWVMRSSTHWDIKSITGNDRQYAGGGGGGKELLGYPVNYSNKAAAVAPSAKPVYFGNWNYVGFREAPGMTVLRDPYSRARYGQIVLHYYFRAVYGVLQPEAIGWGVQAAS